MRISIDQARCCGNLECVRVAPALFSEDEAGLGKVLMEFPPAELRPAAEEAAANCPAAAILLASNEVG
jgi:ferredoxin